MEALCLLAGDPLMHYLGTPLLAPSPCFGPCGEGGHGNGDGNTVKVILTMMVKTTLTMMKLLIMCVVFHIVVSLR